MLDEVKTFTRTPGYPKLRPLRPSSCPLSSPATMRGPLRVPKGKFLVKASRPSPGPNGATVLSLATRRERIAASAVYRGSVKPPQEASEPTAGPAKPSGLSPVLFTTRLTPDYST
jgi:hypothetical protein